MLALINVTMNSKSDILIVTY